MKRCRQALIEMVDGIKKACKAKPLKVKYENTLRDFVNGEIGRVNVKSLTEHYLNQNIEVISSDVAVSAATSNWESG